MFAEQLSRELDAWVRDGLVTGEQADRIRVRYAETAAGERRSRVVSTLAIIGAVVAGLGIILFFAANWDALPRPTRVALLLATVTAAYAAGYVLRYARRAHPAVGHALLLVGGLAFGATLFLVGQMYHVQAHDPLTFLVWALAAAATGAVARSRLLGSLAILAGGAWLVHEAVEIAGDEGAGYAPAIAALYGAALYALGTWGGRRLEKTELAGPLRGLGYVICAAGVFVFTFRGFFDVLDERDPLATSVTVGLAVLAFATVAGAIALASTKRPTALGEAAALAATVVLVLLAILVPAEGGSSFDGEGGPILYPLLFNVLFAALAVGAVLTGYANDEVWLVNAGVVFVAVDVFARYVDFFWDMLPRSLVFIGAGLLLLLLAFGLGRQRARLVERMEAS